MMLHPRLWGESSIEPLIGGLIQFGVDHEE